MSAVPPEAQTEAQSGAQTDAQAEAQAEAQADAQARAQTDAQTGARTGLLRDPRLAALLRVGLGLMFLYAGISKGLAPAAFAEDIANYRLLPGAWVPLVAVTLPWMEILAGVALVAGWTVRGAALVVAGMLVVFAFGIGQALVRGIDLSCGCFGAGDAPATWWMVVRNGVLIAACAHVYFFDRARFGVPVPSRLQAQLG